ncbi:HupV protein [Aestuariivirga litoralis]|uniref:HupV protein n=1 Tax=Aestuariivirga litoralis TaxID=2650924 RepID=A0A2W2BJU5_9HYPH|nr:nickel-dependent hydrogenase large subunit [Aestuariivirga litoralis]PZF76469.1 HupV protein [Aestuariivirga litoralis]
MTRRIIGPFNRVEGDLEVKVEIADGAVREAWVTSPLYRGFEHILRGKPPRDALVYAPRICGICSVSQSVAAARAIAAAQELTPVPNGLFATDLMLAAENVADHLTHFYMFFMPDVCREVYASEPWHAAAVERFRAVKGEAVPPFLAARAGFLHLMGILAGKWPHTLAIQPGGSTRPVEVQEQVRLSLILAGFRQFLERQVFGGTLEAFAALSSPDDLDAWHAADPGRGDLRRFLTIARSLEFEGLGRAADRFMSYGSFGPEDRRLFAPGTLVAGRRGAVEPAQITEDVSHGWMGVDTVARHPFDGMTVPDADNPAGYSWCKAPRLDGATMEVGALARQAIDGQPLAFGLVASGGGNVLSRIVARFIEVARLVPAMESWARALDPREPFCDTRAIADECEGMGLAEAARGSLGHWVKIRKGYIHNYQIIAPTTWNFSPRDRGGAPGPLEQALAGAPVRPGETDPVAVQHIVRSFDPCMVCTVH